MNYKVVDVSNFDQVQKAVNEITLNNKIDILINNAGITGPTAELWNYNIKDWNSILDINLHGTFYCCKSIVPHMIKNNYGRIVNIASVSGKDGNANASAYSSAKAGVIGLTKSLGKELSNYNIAVNAVTPAGAKTRILNQMTKEHVQRMLSKVPRGRFLEINELSSMVCWLSSEENSFSTFQVIFRNGVSFRLILISFPSPEAELFASAFKNLPFTLFPNEYLVFESAPLTFLTFNLEISFSVNSNTFIFLDNTGVKKNK